MSNSGAFIGAAGGLSNPVTPTQGGTGVSNPTAHTIPVAEGSSNFNFIGPLTAGQLIIGTDNTHDPATATLTAGANVTITNGSGTITIASTGGVTWQTITASQTLAVNNGYICISPGGALSLALPTTAAVGSIIEVTLDGATSFVITQSAGQQIRIGASQTTSGATGTLTTTAQGNTLRLVCSVANLKFNVLSSMGNFIVA
jgi:hypothetical protein